MRKPGRRTGWLGWAVAGVLLLSAGGVALAAQDTPSTTQGAVDKADKARAGAALGHGRRGWRHALGRRALHGEMTLQTKEAVKTVVLARGEVTALSGDAVTVKSADGVSTTFRINGDTRYGFRNEPAPTAELKVGDTAWVVGDKSGDTTTARRIVSGEPPQRNAGKDKSATP
jgi:hypothetical protein